MFTPLADRAWGGSASGGLSTMGLATRLRFSHRMTRLAAADPAWSGSAACDLSTVGLGQAPADAINSTAPAWQPPKQPENHALLEPIWDQDDTSGLQVLLQGMLVPRISRHTSKKYQKTCPLPLAPRTRHGPTSRSPGCPCSYRSPPAALELAQEGPLGRAVEQEALLGK